MTVNLYNTTSDAHELNKTLSLVSAKTTVEPVGPMDPINPTFKLSGDSISSVLSANYLESPSYGRYYFCTPTLGPAGIYYLNCQVDPLMSFRDEIKGLSAIVARGESGVNPYLPDNNLKRLAYEQVKTLEFSQGFSKSLKYYLVAIGGASTDE